MLLNLLSVTEDAATTQDPFTSMVSSVSSMTSDEIVSWLTSSVLSVGSKIVLALIIYIVGAWVIKRIIGMMKRVMEARSVEVSLSSFLISLVNITLMIFLIFTIVGVLGINTSSFLALFASAGLAIGMALSGTLQNFAGGVLILFLKPFKIGDFIEAQGFSGTVKEISLFSTLLNTPDNKMVIIPNGSLSNNTINNYSKESTRCISWVIGVSYGTDAKKVTEVVSSILDNHPLVLQDKVKLVEITTLNDSSVDFIIKAWCESSNYWALNFDIYRKIYDTFNAEGIEFPFPQVDVNLKK
ncbi:MAG: mechanosensitive ion channel domain-containing protein [Rikenellaceae bacterium]